MKRFLLFIIFSMSVVITACTPQAITQPVTPAPIASQEAVPELVGYPTFTLPAFTTIGIETQIGFNIEGWT